MTNGWKHFRGWLLAISCCMLILGIIMVVRPQISAVLTIVVLDAVIGVIEESKATNALEALKQMSAPTAAHDSRFPCYLHYSGGPACNGHHCHGFGRTAHGQRTGDHP